MNNLPKEVIDKINLYRSHPTSDIIKESKYFKFIKYKLDAYEGCPFNYGKNDGRLNKSLYPKCIKNKKLVDYHDMSVDEQEAYVLAYMSEDNNITRSILGNRNF